VPYFLVLLFDVVIYETLKIKKHLTIKVKCFVNKYYIVYKESFFKGKTKEKSKMFHQKIIYF